MKIYKELEVIGFFEWYRCQYGSLNYAQYEDVFDQLPLDNIMRTQLNACAFKFFAEKYGVFAYTYTGNGKLFHYCMYIQRTENQYHSDTLYLTDDNAQFECLKKLITKTKLWSQK